MSSKMTLPAIVIAVFAGFSVASIGFAQSTPAPGQARQGQGAVGGTSSMPQAQGMSGMMSGANSSPQEQNMVGGPGNMAEMMNMMHQMTRMMENCNRMMESADHNPGSPNKPSAAHAPPG
jgi:hypothetical protein